MRYIEIYFNSKTIDEFSKIYSVVKAMDTVIDEQYIHMLKKDKKAKGLMYIRSGITFLSLAERMMTENKKFTLYGKMRLEKSREKYKEEVESKEIELHRYPYLVNIIGKNAILDMVQQSIGVCLVYQTWYIEQKIKELDVHFEKSPELKSLKIIMKSIVSSMKKFFKLWAEELEEFYPEEVFEITKDMGPELFFDKELDKFNKIINSEVQIFFKDADKEQKKQKFYTGFYKWNHGKLPYTILSEENSNNISQVFENLKKIGLLFGVHEPLPRAIKGTEEIYKRIKLEASSVALNSIFGKGEYVFTISGAETVETPHTDIIEAWDYFCCNSKIYTERKRAVLSKTSFFPQKIKIFEQEVEMGMATLYETSKNRMIEIIVAVIGNEYIETWTQDPIAALNYVKMASVLIFKKESVT